MTRVSITAGATAGSKRRAATHYGPREIEDVIGSKYQRDHNEEVLEIAFSYDDLPTNGLDEAIHRIPANAHIKEATLRVITAFAGGTSYNIGLNQPDGTVIDADGIDAAVLTAAIDAVGETVLCDGALVNNTAGIGTAEGQVVIAATGTYTAGKAVLKVVYTPLYDRA
jgi:hypothetical protein